MKKKRPTPLKPLPPPAPFTPLTPDEQAAWEALAVAWNHFSKLPATHPSHTEQMMRAIHSAQDVLGLRVLQRTFPGTWATYQRRIESTGPNDPGHTVWVQIQPEPK